MVVVRTLGYRWTELGINFKSIPIQLGIASSGLLFGWVEYLILEPEAMITQLTWSEFVPLALVLLIFTGLRVWEACSIRKANINCCQSAKWDTF